MYLCDLSFKEERLRNIRKLFRCVLDIKFALNRDWPPLVKTGGDVKTLINCNSKLGFCMTSVLLIRLKKWLGDERSNLKIIFS